MPMSDQQPAPSMRVALETFYPPEPERLRFMKQLGVDDVVVWGTTFAAPGVSHGAELQFDRLVALRTMIEDAGLRLFAIETLPLEHYDQIILGGDGAEEQIEHYVNTIRAVGRAGIRVLGYNWMPSGVWRTSYTRPLRGGALGTGFDAADVAGAPLTYGRRYREDDLWEHYQRWLERVVPVAEEEDVTLALHPNDPPVAEIGGTPFLMRSFDNIRRAMELVPSPRNALAFCLGSWAEMGVDLHQVARHFGPQGKLVYVHFQAVRGAVPSFQEVFVDEADHDAWELVSTLDEVGFHGVMIPGHVPQVEGDVEWRPTHSLAHTPYAHPMGGYRSRAYTVGYLRGLLHALKGRP